MSKRKHRAQRAPQTSDIVASLQYRAMERCGGLGHQLGPWTPAKRKTHGPASMKAMCDKCGEVVFVAPYTAVSRTLPQVPAIKGEILFQLCHVQGTLL